MKHLKRSLITFWLSLDSGRSLINNDELCMAYNTSPRVKLQWNISIIITFCVRRVKNSRIYDVFAIDLHFPAARASAICINAYAAGREGAVRRYFEFKSKYVYKHKSIEGYFEFISSKLCNFYKNDSIWFEFFFKWKISKSTFRWYTIYVVINVLSTFKLQLKNI